MGAKNTLEDSKEVINKRVRNGLAHSSDPRVRRDAAFPCVSHHTGVILPNMTQRLTVGPAVNQDPGNIDQ